jgi:hypothetical protein
MHLQVGRPPPPRLRRDKPDYTLFARKINLYFQSGADLLATQEAIG